MTVLRSHIKGEWVEGAGEGTPLFNPTTEEELARASTGGLDLGGALEYARRVGGPALRQMTFSERGELIGMMAKVIHSHRDHLLDLSTLNNGATRSDGKFDVDGGTGTLFAYAELGRALGDKRVIVDGEEVELTRTPRFVGRHIRLPLEGAALHINAFNFPVWGFAEKVASALLAGMPVVTKPAPATALIAARVHELLVEAQVAPAGALSFVAGDPQDIVSHLRLGDVLAFTGSRRTGTLLRRELLEQRVRLNVEADSLNAAVLGPDVEADEDTYASFLADVVRDMTQKAGQKCTAIRRIFVPAALFQRVTEDLSARLSEIVVGDPALPKVRMGPLVSAAQLGHFREAVDRLGRSTEVVAGSPAPAWEGVEPGRGYFTSPVLLRTKDPFAAREVHEIEAFGPCATLMPYGGKGSEAVALVRLAEGGLVSSVYTDDHEFARDMVLGLAPVVGRVYLGGSHVADLSPGPGAVFPTLVHGGPGRAGGGEELGGLRGLELYTQRTAVQGYKPMVSRAVTH